MNARERRRMAEDVATLQAKADTLTRGLIMEQRRVSDLDQALKLATTEIAAYRQKTKQVCMGQTQCATCTCHHASSVISLLVRFSCDCLR